MRQRLPFFNAPERQVTHPPEPPADDAAAPEPLPDEVEGTQRIGKAFEQIARLVVDEIDALHGTTDALDHRLSERVEEIRADQQKALADSADEAKRNLAELRSDFEQKQSLAATRTEEVKSALEQIIADKEQLVQSELGDLAGSLDRLEEDLRRVSEASKNVTALLNGLAGVLSGHAALEHRDPAGPALPVDSTREQA